MIWKRTFNGNALIFLATQSPVGSDLRYCISVMKMIRDLERIGDHCEDLAKYTMRLKNADYGQELVNIPRMADLSAKMVSNAIQSFLTRDLRMARKVWKADEEMDEMFRTVYDHTDSACHPKTGQHRGVYHVCLRRSPSRADC